MAIEFCPNNSSRGMSPRISFSQDFNQTDGVPIEPHKPQLLLDSPEFDFCVRRSYDDHESSLADEIFSNGVILPAQIKKKPLPTKHIAKSDSRSSSSSTTRPLLPPPLPRPAPSKDEYSSSLDVEDKQQQQNSKSFWGFKRSRSLNCGSIYSRKLCPLPLLSRSKSTGTASNSKRSLFSKDDRLPHCNFQNAQKNSNPSSLKISQSSSPSSFSHQKPPLKKNYGSMGNNGVAINPFLNVASANPFGFGSIFSAGKDKSKKK
ncbi:hypothetical protein Nepgr_029042 [Nepenthes gracilis]|uniref:Uncharacterized protein n=1 Tax=Nepenthes gracilis TaxID=150966 RepID=A0AAD3TE15_NEPGR|nr:hypothetical protein Nepgr_029042 [Nepenthes gracilis]